MNIPKILEGFGINTESVNRIRLGRGVIGKSATIGVWALIVLGIAASRLKDDQLLMLVVGAACLLFAIFFIGSMIYGAMNPAAALLRGPS